MGCIRVEVNGLARLKSTNFGAQGELQVPGHDIDELFTFMFIGYRLVSQMGVDGHHEGAQVAFFCTGCQGGVTVVLGALVEGLGTAVANGGPALLCSKRCPDPPPWPGPCE